jgi:hypothetical protein
MDIPLGLVDVILLSYVHLSTDASFSAVISNCLHAKEAYDTLKQRMSSALNIRESVNMTRTTYLSQGSSSIGAYLCEAQDTMFEARTIEVPAQMEQLCTQIVTGLRGDILRAISDAISSISESILRSESSADDIRTVFTLMVN